MRANLGAETSRRTGAPHFGHAAMGSCLILSITSNPLRQCGQDADSSLQAYSRRGIVPSRSARAPYLMPISSAAGASSSVATGASSGFSIVAPVTGAASAWSLARM